MSDGERVIYGVTSYDLGGNAGFVVHCLFNSEVDALTYASARPEDYRVEEYVLYDYAPEASTYWTIGGMVLPDGSLVDMWERETIWQPPSDVRPVQEAEVRNGRVWGWGTDRERLVSALIAAARPS